jgi:hypothetical protein
VTRPRTKANLSLAARSAARQLRVLAVQEAAGVFPTARSSLDALTEWVAGTVRTLAAYDEDIASALAVYAGKLRRRRRGFAFEYAKLLELVEAIGAAPWSPGVAPKDPAPEELTVRDLLQRMRLKTVWAILGAIVLTLAGAIGLGAWLEHQAAAVLDAGGRPATATPESRPEGGEPAGPVPPLRHI